MGYVRAKIGNIDDPKSVDVAVWKALALERGRELSRLRAALDQPEVHSSREIVDAAIKRLKKKRGRARD